jgi:predicted dienelactone hydrolase
MLHIPRKGLNMRPIEIIVPLLLSTYLLWQHPRPFVIRLLAAFALILIFIHFFIEGYRWQMTPIYTLTAVLVISSLIKIQSAADWKPLASYLTFGLLAVSTALPILLPVPAIPTPSGPYQVGTRIYELTDPSRKEIYSGQDEARRFMIQVWYPAEAGSSTERARWMDRAEIYAPSVSDHIGMPAFFLNHLALMKVPAYKNAKVAQTDQRLPVILFSHGWQGFNAQNTGQALELASNGFIVVGVQHAYGAVITVFPDGTIANNNPSALPEGALTAEYENAAHILADQWAGDLGFTLEYLETLNNVPDGPFLGHLDLDRVGVYGHSTGGGAAIQFCGTDPRCIALLGLDPFMRPVSYEVIDSGVTQPAFFMFSQLWSDDVDSRNNELFNKFLPHVKDPFGVVSIAGTAHYDFADLPLLSPLAPQLGLKGPINGKRVVTIVDDYLLTFFESTLKGNVTSLFDIPSPYPEVKARN